jgi:hypothetical protein
LNTIATVSVFARLNDPNILQRSTSLIILLFLLLFILLSHWTLLSWRVLSIIKLLQPFLISERLSHLDLFLCFVIALLESGKLRIFDTVLDVEGYWQIIKDVFA